MRLHDTIYFQVLLSKNDGDDPLTIIYGALHSSDNQNSSFKVQKPSSMSQNMKDCLGAHVKELFPSKHLSTADLSSLRSRHFNRDYRGIPSNLITSCVATLLMIQVIVGFYTTDRSFSYYDNTDMGYSYFPAITSI